MSGAGPGVPRLERGIFMVSIDTELAWGGFDHPTREARWKLEEGSREAIRRLLELFERYEISATWAVIGHLFLDSCECGEGRAHPEIPRPNHAWLQGDWFQFDPCSAAAEAPLWYAPDVIRALSEAKPRQEIGSHSFSHVIFGDPGCSAEAAKGDIEACVRAAGQRGIRLRSMVYPRNRIGHESVLRECGFLSYRGVDPAWFAPLPRYLRRPAHFLDDLLALPPPTVTPRRQDGLWVIPGSMMFQGLDGLRGLIPSSCRTRRCLTGLARAAERREIFHVWFHPVNFVTRINEMLKAFEPVLRTAAQLRDQGAIENVTMGDLAERLQS